MDNSYTIKHNGGYSHLNRILLLLCLAGLQPVLILSTDGENEMTPESDDSDDGGLTVAMKAPAYVTVSVPSSVECEAHCPSSCTYSMALDGQVAQGQGKVLAFTVNRWVEALSVTCTVTDDNTGQNARATRQLQVLAGPANISITGSDLMKPTEGHTYSCHAYCRPSCTYAWQINKGPWISGQGNVISITPKELDTSQLLICKAINTVSGMFVAAVRNINVTTGPAQVQISGPDVVEVARKSKFACTAECLPSCRYLWSVDSHLLRGNTIEVTVDQPVNSIEIKCEAQNTVSKKSATISTCPLILKRLKLCCCLLSPSLRLLYCDPNAEQVEHRQEKTLQHWTMQE
ncbi:hypothetical protein LDENG_00057220 [Lucifuga dentata]|nr:hypothetical protein LDENG_00057220 [Lucifuga dentata]